MKRSEMLKTIQDYFTGITDLSDADNQLAAQQLLRYIEDAGMAPPEADIPMSREVAPGQEITWFKKMRQWEAE